jgi:hypothetical protein
MPRCLRGSRKNKNGECIKHNRTFSKKNSSQPKLTEEDVNKLIRDFNISDSEKDKIKDRLFRLKYRKTFKNDFYKLNAKKNKELNKMYDNDSFKKKEHLLYEQAEAKLAALNKGYIELNEIR